VEREDALRLLEGLFRSALDALDPYEAIRSTVKVQNGTLRIRGAKRFRRVRLDSFAQVLVVGMGKAAGKMARALEDALGGSLSRGLVIVPDGYKERLDRTPIYEAAHPLPDDKSLEAARKVRELAASADEKTLVFFLVSGGGSSVIEEGACFRLGEETIKLSIDDLRATVQLLLLSGATIEELNAVRKHLSAIKGGRLLRLFERATSVSLILSDVVGDPTDVIASGPTVGDTTTYADALYCIERLGLTERVPQAAVRLLMLGAEGKLSETPTPNELSPIRHEAVLVGSNQTGLLAAKRAAGRLGFRVLALTSRLQGEAREVGKVLWAIARDCAENGLIAKPPVLLLAGGETTVSVAGEGKGGRCQELALSFLLQAAKEGFFEDAIVGLIAASDGKDGNSDAAGAFIVPSLFKGLGLSLRQIAAYLDRNDSASFFERYGGVFRTGPTGTNACDYAFLLVRPRRIAYKTTKAKDNLWNCEESLSQRPRLSRP
jgi:hydroxypyruvate reductase